MGKLKIGVMVESFRLGVRGGIRKAAEVGADGVQLYVTHGELAPENLSRTGRGDLLHFVRSCGLQISALCGELGGFCVEGSVLEQRIERTRRILDLSHDFGVPIVTGHIGIIPDDKGSRAWEDLLSALAEVGAYAENLGSCIAAETGPEDTRLMRDFLETLPNRGTAVNYDPANLVMRGFDPVRGVYDLKGYIVHTHAKDGLHDEEGKAKEVPLGEGQVPFPEYLAALDDIGYGGFHTIEREVRDHPEADIRKALEFLRRF